MPWRVQLLATITALSAAIAAGTALVDQANRLLEAIKTARDELRDLVDEDDRG